MSNDRKWLALSFVLGGVLLAWVLNQFFVMIARFARFSNPTVLGVLPASALMAGGVAFLFTFFFARQDKVSTYGLDVLAELKKVVWPLKDATAKATLVVVFLVVFMAFILGFLDWVCARFVGLVLGT